MVLRGDARVTGAATGTMGSVVEGAGVVLPAVAGPAVGRAGATETIAGVGTAAGVIVIMVSARPRVSVTSKPRASASGKDDCVMGISFRGCGCKKARRRLPPDGWVSLWQAGLGT